MNKTCGFLGKWSVLLAMPAIWGMANLAAMDLPGLERAFAELQRESAADADSVAVRKLLREMNANFHPMDWLMEAPSPDMASPSPQRWERIHQLARAIAPYETVLVDLGFHTTPGSDADRAILFLWYAAPSPTLKQSLLGAADRNPLAYEVLFETGMFDDQVRSRFVQGLSASASPELRRQRASMASTWGLVEAIPVYMEMLQKPFDPATISFVGHIPASDAKSSLPEYGAAAMAAMYLGPAGAPLLPLLKQRYSEIQTAFPEKGLVLTGGLKAAIDVLEGKRDQQLRTAKNGRGAINLTKGYSPIARTTEAAPPAPTPPPPAGDKGSGQ